MGRTLGGGVNSCLLQTHSTWGCSRLLKVMITTIAQAKSSILCSLPIVSFIILFPYKAPAHTLRLFEDFRKIKAKKHWRVTKIKSFTGGSCNWGVMFRKYRITSWLLFRVLLKTTGFEKLGSYIRYSLLWSLSHLGTLGFKMYIHFSN